MGTVMIGGIPVGDGHPCFVVAEIGINHLGSVPIALQMIDAAVEAGCQAVKFQKRHVPTVYTPDELRAARSTPDVAICIEHALERMRNEDVRESIFSESDLARLMVNSHDTTNGHLKRALEFGLKEFDTIDRHCRERGILWFGSAWDGHSIHFLCGFRRIAAHKVASACLTHRDLLLRIREDEKPVILSTGGSTLEQVKCAVDVLGSENLIILCCTAAYPCADEDINLNVMSTLRETFPGVPIGYSGHEVGIAPSLVAASLGAAVIERHITLDRSMPGSDQKASLEPKELRGLVQVIRRLGMGEYQLDELVPPSLQALYRGSPEKRVLASEVPVMAKLRRVKDF